MCASASLALTCDALPGFILRILPTGKKVALARYRVDGKDRRVKIGLLGPALSIEEARRRAAVMLADVTVSESVDEPSGPPAAGGRARVKQVESAPSQIVTLRELAERFVRTYVDVYLKPGTAERYRHALATIILPGLADPKRNVPPLGDRDYRTIKRSHIAELHAAMKDRPGSANNMVMVVASLYTRIIEDWELAAELRSPAHGIKLFPMRKRERFLTPEERQRLHVVIRAGLKIPAGRRGHLKVQSVWALDLLALTGRRRDEILTLTWPMVDWQHSLLNIPDTKTGELKVPVSARVLGLLKHIHDQAGNPRTGYVLRTAKGTRLTGLNATWYNIRKAADLTDVRLHDLRHSFASDALMSGVPLATVGKLLGHKQARTTERYAHLANDVVRQALEQATERIVEAVGPVVAALPPAPFVPMSDAQWKAIAAIVESTRGPCGPRTDLRRTVDGIRWVLHSGAKWSEIPAEYGRATTAWRWYERWCSDGTWQQIAATLALPPTEVGRAPGRRPPRGKSRRATGRHRRPSLTVQLARQPGPFWFFGGLSRPDARAAGGDAVIRATAVALLLAGCGHSRPATRWGPLEVTFVRPPVVDDCAAMESRADSGEAWSMTLALGRDAEVAVYASDEVWVLAMSESPPSRWEPRAVQEVELRCGPEHMTLRARACSKRTGPWNLSGSVDARQLSLYVDPAQLAGWKRRGSAAASCEVRLQIDSAIYREQRPVVLRPGVRAEVQVPDRRSEQ